MRKVQGKITCGQEEELYERVTSRRKDFCGHDWSIYGDFDWGSVLDWLSRRLQSLLLDFLHEDQVANAEENGIFLQKYDVTWDSI